MITGLLDDDRVKLAGFPAQAAAIAQLGVDDVRLLLLATDGVVGAVAPTHHTSGAQFLND